MRLKTRVLIIILASLLGLVVMGGLGLYSMRQSMIEERRSQLVQVLEFGMAQLKYYHGLEMSGKLTREEAQARAKAAIGAQRSGDEFFSIRTIADNVLLVHSMQSRVGRVDTVKLPDGRFIVDVQHEALRSNKGKASVLWLDLPHPRKQDKPLYPKMTGIIEFEPWGWSLGSGFFVEDIDTRFWKQSVLFLIAGGTLLALLAGLALRMRSVILRQLGGEPQEAAERMKRIANGDLGVEFALKKDDNSSLMASLKLMQMKLKNITQTIQENSSTLENQAQSFNMTAKTYAETRSEDDLSELLKAVKQLGRTVDILGKSVSRFKS